MRWSYNELLATPAPVADEIISWMREMNEEAERERNKPRRR
jgi:hypothetical protein